MVPLDPLAHRVALRYLAEVEFGRLAVEYQRRTHGLERVEREDDEDGQDEVEATTRRCRASGG